MEEGLVGDEAFAVDASLIEADANRQRGVPGTEGGDPSLPSRAVGEYLAVLDDAAFGAAPPLTSRCEIRENANGNRNALPRNPALVTLQRSGP